MLKKLYHELFPRTVRHDLGEYYTPDWLAEDVLNELSYTGDPDKRLLDPACGSGTFLVMAINRIRRWYDENREKCRFEKGELCVKILSNVTGFDLNPLAVMAARTNYLIAIRDLIGHVDKVEIPIYLCDSILTPSEHGGLLAGRLGEAKEFETAAATFIIPTEITRNREDVARYAEQIEFCAKNNYTPDQFLQRCREESLPVTAKELHAALYGEIVKLDKANKNGVWARIIKNAFAPLFTEPVDYVVGNPPWVLWDNLPTNFREALRKLMTNTFGLMASGQSTFTRLGQAKKDLSMIFFYCSLDRYCKDSGKLGFVITQTLFQTTAGNEFRRFCLPNGTPIEITKVEDWAAVEPFRPKAGNKTATVFASLGRRTSYPVPYTVWIPVDDFDRESATLSQVFSSCEKSDRWAHLSDQSNSTSFWALSSHRAASPSGSYELMRLPKARAGVNTSLESAYKIELLDAPRPGFVFIRNITKGAKKPVPVREAVIEDALILPFLSGESLKRWSYTMAGYYIVPHTSETGMRSIDEDTMKRKYRMTYAYFYDLKEFLKRRSLHLRWGTTTTFTRCTILDHTHFPHFGFVGSEQQRSSDVRLCRRLKQNISDNESRYQTVT